MNKKTKDKIWRMSKPAKEYPADFLVVPALDIVRLIEQKGRER